MRVYVYHEFAGSLRFALEFRHNGRRVKEYVRAEKWSRAVATEALDMLQYCFGVDRSSVRFYHH